ncbi:MAG: PAS domain S-box protein [Ktedonobacteraceae bacterium]
MVTTSKKIQLSSHTVKALKHNEQYSHSLIKNGSDIIVLVNEESIVTFVSPSITSILGYAPEEIVGCHVLVLVHPDDLDTVQWMLGEIGQSPGKSLSAEYRLCCKDGSWRWFEGSGTNLLHVPGIEAIVGNFRDVTERKVAPHSHWSEMSTSEHFVQFYESEVFLLDSLSGFIDTGLSAGDACIVIATKAHRERLEERLKAKGLDLIVAQTRDEYIALDAVETLSKFMVDGLPEPQRFLEIIGSIIRQAGEGRLRVRAFGEMVALLWEEGNQAGAIHLEELWNDLARTHSFSLFCAYPMHGFGKAAHGAPFTEIGTHHTRVIPAESYNALATPDERLRAVTLLQQKAESLHAEIMERKEVEKALRISETRYRRLFEAARDGVLILDPRTRKILDANPFMEELLGYTREELIGKELFEIGLHKDEQANQDAFRKLQENHYIRYEDLPLKTKRGERRDIEVVANLYEEEDKPIIQYNIRDISARKKLERQKDEFISMASHELKTPVTSLKGFLNLLQRRLTSPEDEKELHYLARMNAQVHKLAKLINDLLDISKMQTGQLAYREEHFDVYALVQEIVENIQGTTQTHHLLLESQTQAEAFGDRDRIGQVLINLLNNAIKYSPQASTVVVRVAKDHNNALVSVQDFGIGIAKEHQQKIFERFYQVTDPEERTYPGLGIGLYISLEIVKRHGGQIWVESKKGEGTTFHFTLPLFQEGKRQVSL